MTLIAAWQAVSAVGWPPELPEKLPWTPILFGVFTYLAFFSLVREKATMNRFSQCSDPSQPCGTSGERTHARRIDRLNWVVRLLSGPRRDRGVSRATGGAVRG